MAYSFPMVSGSVIWVGSPVRDASSASPREWAGSVDTTRTDPSKVEEASSTAREALMVVFPTPPFPPTKIVLGEEEEEEDSISWIKLVMEERVVRCPGRIVCEEAACRILMRAFFVNG